VGYKFYFKGSDVVKNFCETNNIDMIARAHQLVMEGLNGILMKRFIFVLKFQKNLF